MNPKQATMNHPANISIKTPSVTRRSWTCERCNIKLPKSGLWHHRYVRWMNNPARATSGYYCDDCTIIHDAETSPDPSI
jgi:hypothetical protein